MPRLLGKRSSSVSAIGVAFFLGLAIGGGAVSEYLGVINLVPHFGKESQARKVTFSGAVAQVRLDSTAMLKGEHHA